LISFVVWRVVPSFLMFLIVGLSLPQSLFITEIYLRWVHAELVETRPGISSFQVLTKQVKA